MNSAQWLYVKWFIGKIEKAQTMMTKRDERFRTCIEGVRSNVDGTPPRLTYVLVS